MTTSPDEPTPATVPDFDAAPDAGPATDDPTDSPEADGPEVVPL